MERDHVFFALVAIALSFTLGCISTYDPISGVLAMVVGFGFISYVLWLLSRPKVDVPEIIRLRAVVSELKGEHEVLKNKLDGLLLRGRRGD